MEATYMPRPVSDIDILQEYLRGVQEKAEHHAGNVDEVALALVGAVVWKKDMDPIEVMEHRGKMTNVLWVRIGGQRYAFSYNHDSKAIEIRRGTTHGAVLKSFSNANTGGEIKAFFKGL